RSTTSRIAFDIFSPHRPSRGTARGHDTTGAGEEYLSQRRQGAKEERQENSLYTLALFLGALAPLREALLPGRIGRDRPRCRGAHVQESPPLATAPRTRPTLVRYGVLAALCLAATIAYVHRNCIGVAEEDIRKDL